MFEDRVHGAFLVICHGHGCAIGSMDCHHQLTVMHDGSHIGELGHAQRTKLWSRDPPQICRERLFVPITVFERIVQFLILTETCGLLWRQSG